MRKLVYIASPLSGDAERNLDFARRACLNAIRQGATPFAPHLLYPQMLDDNDPDQRQLGIDMGNQMLGLCDELWLCGDRISPGMAGEEQAARELGIPIRQITAKEVLDTTPYALSQKTSAAPGIRVDFPSVYAIWATGTPDGPLSGQSGYLAQDDSLLLFGDTAAVERKIKDLQNHCMNGHPSASFEAVTCDRSDLPTQFVLAEDIAQYDLRLDTDHLEHELRSQAYGNTGGGCMVGTQSFFLPELDKTVWVNCDSESVTVTTADHIWNQDHSDSWDRYEDVLLFSAQFADVRPEALGAWLPMVKDTLAYTMEQQVTHGRQPFDLPNCWLPEEQEPPPSPSMDAPC